MSIVALKRNSRRFIVPISGKDSKGFSLVGGHRNIGVVGPTNLAKSVTRTPFRGIAPMGNGGSLGSYVVSVSNSGSCCTNDAEIIKNTVKNTSGMIAEKYKWLNGTYPNWWVQDTSPLKHSQGAHIIKKQEETARCGVMLSTDAGTAATSCEGNKGVQWINGIPRCSRGFTKDVNVAVSSSKYMTTGLLKKRCLPAPASKQAFPFPVNNGDNCVTTYDTWQEAQQAGLLPANYVG
jgi:hypothetical protein